MDDAILYEESNSMARRDVRNILKEFKSQIQWKESEIILDIGCGSGDVTSQV